VGVSVNVTARLDPGAFRGWLENEGVAAVGAATGVVRDYAKAEITAAGRVNTGRMRQATVSEVARVEGNRIVGRVVTETDYAIYQHEGTRSPITPVRARVLRFRGAGGAFVFRPEVKGVEGVPFLTNALDRLRPDDFAR
jgi:RNase P/RNase MRP subunit p29